MSKLETLSDVDSIVICSESLYNSHFIRVSCEDFTEKIDRDTLITQRTLLSRTSIDALEQLLEKRENMEQSMEMDVRAILILHRKSNSDTICANNFCFKYHDILYEMQPAIRAMIWADESEKK